MRDQISSGNMTNIDRFSLSFIFELITDGLDEFHQKIIRFRKFV